MRTEMQELNAEKTAARQSMPDGAAGCPIFPGIEILYDDVHAQKYTMQRTPAGNVFEITHCREGRIERSFRKEFCYLSPGDLSVAMESDISGSRSLRRAAGCWRARNPERTGAGFRH